jgi:hypothetical protein
MGRAISSLITLAVLVYIAVAVSGFYLRGDPAAYLPPNLPGNQILRDWAAALTGQSASPVATPASTGPCAPFSVAISGLENRISLNVAVTDRSGSLGRQITAVLDTGAGESTLPEAALRAAGALPGRTVRITGVVPGVEVTEREYHIDGSQLRVLDGAQYVPLARGPLAVLGDASGAADPLIGSDVLKAGLGVQNTGSTVTLTPPCAG